jgi:MYXO-CTERM domain-containing protein
VLTDPHGSLDCSLSSIAFSGNEVTVSWSLAFAQTLAGTQGVWFDAKGYPDDERLCWTKMGELTVEAGSGWAGGGGASGGMPGMSGAAGRGETAGDDSGCGCRTRGRGDGGWIVLALMIAALVRRRGFHAMILERALERIGESNRHRA